MSNKCIVSSKSKKKVQKVGRNFGFQPIESKNVARKIYNDIEKHGKAEIFSILFFTTVDASFTSKLVFCFSLRMVLKTFSLLLTGEVVRGNDRKDRGGRETDRGG